MLGFAASVVRSVLAGLIKDWLSKWLGQIMKKHRKVLKRQKRKRSKK